MTWFGLVFLLRFLLFLLSGWNFWSMDEFWCMDCLFLSWSFMIGKFIGGWIYSLTCKYKFNVVILSLCHMHLTWDFRYTKASCCMHLLQNCSMMFLYSVFLCMGHVCWTNFPRDNSMIEFILTSPTSPCKRSIKDFKVTLLCPRWQAKLSLEPPWPRNKVYLHILLDSNLPKGLGTGLP